MDLKPSEKLLQVLYWREFNARYRLIVPRYAPVDWHECDLYVVSKRGLATEVEIKISLKDFRNDKLKDLHCMEVWRENPQWRVPAGPGAHGRVYKHARLQGADRRAPNYLYYLVPEDLVDAVRPELPDYAGLLSARMKNSFRITQVCEARRLHGNKPSAQQLEHARGVFYYRYWTLCRGVRMRQALQIDELKSL